MPQRLRAVLVLLISLVLAVTTLGAVAAPASAEDDPIDLLAVSVVGDGTASGNVAVPVAIQILGSDGVLGESIDLPTARVGDQAALTLGADRDQQGALQQSADRQFVTIGGYDHPADATTSLNATLAPEVLRVIGRVDADGEVDTTTTLSDAFSERHIRGAVSSDGTQVWAGGHGNDAPTTQGGVLSSALGATSPTAVVSGNSNLNNSRVPVIHEGQLYVSSDRTGFHGVNQVGDGLPTAAGASQTLIAEAPAGSTVPHDFAFVGDHLYVTYTEGTPVLAKYAQVDEDWELVGTHAGAYWGVTGRVAGDEIALYAIKGSSQANDLVLLVDSDADDFVVTELPVATAPAGTAFRGVAFAPGFVPGTAELPDTRPLPSVSWTPRIAGGLGDKIGAVLGAPVNPTARGTISDPEGAEFDVSVTSSDQAVVPDDAIDFAVDEDGDFVLGATAIAAGKTQLTLTITTDEAEVRTATSRLDYWVSAPLDDPTAVAHTGMSDASAAWDAGDGHFFVADDDSNQIRLFGPGWGEPVAEFDFDEHIAFERPGEAFDLEGVARIDDVLYWVGSLGNTRSGNVRLDRDIVLATRVVGSGAGASLEYVGYLKGLRQALVAWDAQDRHGLGPDHFGFAAATVPGASAEGPDSLNVEGAAVAPDGTSLWLGFRSPLVGHEAGVGGSGLIVAVEDLVGLIEPDGGQADVDDVVATPILLDLGGRAIRDLSTTADGGYLIIAGSAGDEGNFALARWDGDPASDPRISQNLPSLPGWPGSYEGIVSASSLEDGGEVRLVIDSGTTLQYADGTEGQDLAQEHKKFYAQTVTLAYPADPERVASTVEVSTSPSQLNAAKGRATVSTTVTSAGPLTPTGVVEVLVDGDVAGSATLTAGRATVAIGPFPIAGTRRIAVRYLGDDATLPGSSATLTLPVTRSPARIRLLGATKPVQVRVGQRARLRVRVVAPGLRPGARVRVKVQGMRRVRSLRVRRNGVVAIPVRKFPRPGVRRVRIVLPADDATARTRQVIRVRVRR